MFDFLKRKKDKLPFISAVVVAAGSGTRMGMPDKLLLELGDMPVIAHSLAAFCDCRRISEIILVCREEEVAGYYHLVQDYGLVAVRKVVAGGKERQDSVFAGIAACSPDADYFAIHDGARPLVTPELVGECIDAAIEHGAAAAGVPVKDTIKIANTDGFIESTPDRSKLYAIQTPQIFEAKLYRLAMAGAIHIGRSFTDDCQLVEQAGHKVYIANGSYENIKITTPEDIATAHALLEYREYQI